MTETPAHPAAPTPEALEERRRRFAQYLAEKNLKSTRQRHAVAEVFFTSSDHLTIDEMLHLSRRKDSKIGYATVYRTLKLLAEAGLADERHFSDGVARFEQSSGEAHHHDHMVCTGCGDVLEFVSEEIEKLQEDAARRYGFEMVSHKLELYGTCRKCQAKPRKRGR